MAKYNLSIDQHRTWSFYAVVKDENVSQSLIGYTFTLTIKKDAAQKKPFLQRVLFVGNVPENVVNSMPVSFGGVTPGETGSIYLTLSDVETAALPPGNHLYDIEMVKPNGETKTLISGKCFINRVVGE